MTNIYNFRDELDHLLHSQTHHPQAYHIRTNYNNTKTMTMEVMHIGDGVKN